MEPRGSNSTLHLRAGDEAASVASLAEITPFPIEGFTDPDLAARYFSAYDALLHKWPVPYSTCQIPTRLGSTHVISSGAPQAPAIVLLHGMRATGLVWRANVESLSRRFRVHAIDVIGQNGKSVSKRRIRNRWDYANWLCEIFDALQIRKASLIGNSYGGFLALNQASLTPELVNRVVLINPAGIFTSVLPAVLQLGLGAVFNRFRNGFAAGKPDIASFLGRDVQLRSDEREWAAMISLISFSRMRPNMIFPSVFSTAELCAIRAPTLLLLGDNDLLYDPFAMLDIATRRMPSLHAQIIYGAHHIAAMAKPAETNVRILRFLRESSQGNAG